MTSGSRTLLGTLVLALLVQGLIPAGYMPGSLHAGTPIVLCPSGLPQGFLDASLTRHSQQPLAVEGHAQAADDPHHQHHQPQAGQTGLGHEHTPPSDTHEHDTESDVGAFCLLGVALDAAIVRGDFQPAEATRPLYLAVTLRPSPPTPGRRSRANPTRAPPALIA